MSQILEVTADGWPHCATMELFTMEQVIAVLSNRIPRYETGCV